MYCNPNHVEFYILAVFYITEGSIEELMTDPVKLQELMNSVEELMAILMDTMLVIDLFNFMLVKLNF